MELHNVGHSVYKSNNQPKKDFISLLNKTISKRIFFVEKKKFWKKLDSFRIFFKKENCQINL